MRSRSLWIIACTMTALAACGSTAARTADSGTALKLSQCMRSHGLPNFPDPSPNGALQITGIDPQSPAFQAAQAACKQYAPFKSGPPKMTESQRRAATRFAQCMRSNGQSDFPDPTLVPPPGTTHMLVLQGMVFAFSSGIDPKAPAFRAAAAKCGVTPR